jgi:thiopeptide-type bacteriocin biosynthesis protein
MKHLFKDIGSFMIRVPSLPINLLVDNINSADNQENTMPLLDFPYYKKQFDEAILVASHDLYEFMRQYEKGSEVRDTNYLLNSLYKYFSRNCSRCTPFGLFSAVAFGNINSEATSFELSGTDIQRRPLVDSNWLFEVVFMYEAKYLKELKYTPNESVAIHRNKAILFGCTKNKDEEKINKKTVNYTKPLEIIFEISNDYLSYVEIVEKLEEAYPGMDQSILHEYVQSLIKEEYLISDLRPPLTVNNQLEYLICKLKQNDINADTLISIQKQIEDYTDGDKSDKISCLTNVFHSMKEVHPSKNYLTVDSSFEYKECNLNKNDIKKINELINLFLQFNFNESFDKLNDYKNRFIEKYGLSICVPLTELVDPDLGLGFPSANNRNFNSLGEYINPWVRFFERKYVESIRFSKEIEIKDEDIKKLMSEDLDEELLPKSMEIYFNYTKENGEDIFHLSNIFGSTFAGKSFGRFSHLMKDPIDFYKQINAVYDSNDKYKSCEFTFLPDSLVTANVIRNMHGSTYETSFGTTNSKNSTRKLKLNEILVGIKNNKFYLKSAMDNKIIIPTSTNMFNPQLKPEILRFIDDISSDGIKFYNKPWQYLLEKFAYLPTIRYKNFILEQEKWILKIEDLDLPARFSFGEFKFKLREHLESRNISRWINVVEADQKLLLNLEEDRSLSVLQKMLVKSEIVLEKYNVEVEHPVKHNDNSYCCELVIPLISVSEVESSIDDFEITENYGNSRIKVPLDEWLYFKIYGVGENIDYILGDALFTPLQQLLENKEIDSYFFIQYKDPDLHLRLRIKADYNRLLMVQPKLLNIFSQLIKDSLISKYSIDCYELELERYGGYDLMDHAHEVFHKDSLAIQSIIYEKNNNNVKISDELLAVISIFFHVKRFGLSLDEIFIFLNCQKHIKLDQEEQDEFRKNKNSYLDFVIKYLSGEKLTPEIDFIMRILLIKSASMETYLEGIEKFYPESKNVKFSILDSILHMHMNRLFGPNVEFERKMRTLSRHIFYSVYHRNKKTGILEGKVNAKI